LELIEKSNRPNCASIRPLSRNKYGNACPERPTGSKVIVGNPFLPPNFWSFPPVDMAIQYSSEDRIPQGIWIN